ncbi:MAG: methylated-DNA--[protein]-cysteine S-methyltransferase [Desulfovibrionaceae bacterium]|nr:methylated-DNA--[protein]-cysteine S-methyltransferase [Desulfovibrionaceae bacterium]
MEYVYHYRSPLGGITLASDGEALTGLWFDGQKYFAGALDPEHEEKPLPVFEQAEAWLDLYFSGSVPAFTPPLNMKASPFRKRVWEMLLAIPYGQTRTYGEIAAELVAERGARVSAQAVGGAVGRNAIALIIPCHRVVGKSGRLVGYAGGLEKKAWLLALERRGTAPSLSCAEA